MFEKITNKVKKEVEVEETIGEKFVCDECGREVEFYVAGHKTFSELSYYDVTTGHDDWGNDSCESIEHKQYCCADCVEKAFYKFLDENERSNTAYFELRKERHSSRW